jgi:hypothetical protein
MSKARDLANAGTALTTVSATELGYLDGVTSAVQTQINSKEATLPSQTGNSGKYLTTNGTDKSWGTVSQYALPSQTGNSGKFLTTNGTSESWGTVNQPLTWTSRISPDGSGIVALAWNGSNIYVAAGASGKLYSSSDGITWTSRTSNFGASAIYDVQYGNGLFVAVGEAGKITTSTDGTTWTARTSNMGTNQITKVLYANSLWVAVGDGGGTTNTGGITYSSDGLTWTRKSQSLTVGPNYKDLIWNGTNWIIVSSNSTNNHLYATTPSGTWTAATATGGTNLVGIMWDGTRNIYCNDTDGNLYYSASTTITSSTPFNAPRFNNSYQNAKYLYNGMVYGGQKFYTRFIPATASYVVSYNNGPFPFVYEEQQNNSTSGIGNTGGQLTAILANATGVIIATNRGHLYTSF